MLQKNRWGAAHLSIGLPITMLASVGMGVVLAHSHAVAFYGFQDTENAQGESREQLSDHQDNDSADKAERLKQEAEQKRKDEEENALLVRQREEAQTRTTWNRPDCVAGNKQCVDCHREETQAWLASRHSTRAFDLLRTSSALSYAEKLGIRPIDITRSSLCINCHGTPLTKFNGKPDVFAGVSCESCHGSSLGENGWLNIHAVYGTAHTVRELETQEHYDYRQQRCDEAGRLQSSNLYGLTKRCFNCHVVGDEALAKAGHIKGDRFEMVARALGEVRHNFILDEHVNSKVATLWQDPLFRKGGTRTVDGRLRVMFVLGQMVDLEVSLRGLARATDENDFSDALIGRIEDVYELLAEDIVEEIKDIDQEASETESNEASDEIKAPRDGAEKPLGRPELAEIKSVVEIISPLWEKLDDDGFNKEEMVDYVAAADSIAVLAQKFCRRDGNNLQVLDQLELLPLPEDFFGRVYDPNPQPEVASEEKQNDD